MRFLFAFLFGMGTLVGVRVIDQEPMQPVAAPEAAWMGDNGNVVPKPLFGADNGNVVP
jgi:hypothetical protein